MMPLIYAYKIVVHRKSLFAVVHTNRRLSWTTSKLGMEAGTVHGHRGSSDQLEGIRCAIRQAPRHRICGNSERSGLLRNVKSFSACPHLSVSARSVIHDRI